MPGDNCAVVGCGSCRRSKGIGIWKLPAPRNEEYKKWRVDWLNELTKFVLVCKRVRPLKTLSEWTVQEEKDRLLLKKMRNALLLPELGIIIDDSLGYTISVFGWLLP